MAVSDERIEAVTSHREFSRSAEHIHAAMAVDLASRSPGRVRVGAVIACGDDVLVTGFKDERKGLHAEQVAIEKAAETVIDLRGAQLYTTLEPCANSRTGRISCAELISEVGISGVHIGAFDKNPLIYRLGWKYLRDHGIKVLDFPADLREVASGLNADFSGFFERGLGMNGGAKFDFTQNGGKFTIAVDEGEGSPSWETQWTNCGADAIYLYGGYPGVVALARYAEEFAEIDDPDALDYNGSSAMIDVGSIGVMRNDHGHVLCKVIAIEPTVEYGGTGQVSVKIKWQIRLLPDAS